MRLLTRILALASVIVTVVYAQAQGVAPGQQIIDEGNGQKSVPLRTHSLYPPYLDSDLQSRWYAISEHNSHLGGNLEVTLSLMQTSITFCGAMD